MMVILSVLTANITIATSVLTACSVVEMQKNFSVLVRTIFENTKISLVKWFMAMYLVSSHKKGISSHQLARDIEVTQKLLGIYFTRYAHYMEKMILLNFPMMLNVTKHI